MNGRRGAWSVVLALGAVLAGCTAGSRPGTGTVELKVAAQPRAGVHEPPRHVAVYDAAPAPAHAQAEPRGQYEHVDYASLGDVVVWLEPGPRDAPGPAPLPVEVDASRQAGPVRAASLGQKVTFRNRGAGPVSLYSVSDENDFTLATIPPGGEGSYDVKGAGLIEVLADPSRPPVAVIYAAPSPWAVATRAGKTVVFNDVPPGSYEAQSWHPRLPGASAALTVAPDRLTRSTLVVGVRNLAPDRQADRP